MLAASTAAHLSRTPSRGSNMPRASDDRPTETVAHLLPFGADWPFGPSASAYENFFDTAVWAKRRFADCGGHNTSLQSLGLIRDPELHRRPISICSDVNHAPSVSASVVLTLLDPSSPLVFNRLVYVKFAMWALTSKWNRSTPRHATRCRILPADRSQNPATDTAIDRVAIVVLCCDYADLKVSREARQIANTGVSPATETRPRLFS